MADARNRIVINDFSGGMNKAEPDRIGMNEGATLENFNHTEGMLASYKGRNLFNGGDYTYHGSNPVLSVFNWQKTGQAVNNSNATTQTEWPLIKCRGAIWAHFGVDANGAPYAFSSSNKVYKPIAVRTSGIEESFSTFGGYLYMANGTDDMIRWDGRYYAVGSCNCSGGTTVTGTSTKWASYDSVREGDAFFFYETTGTDWTLTEYRIASITDDTHLELTTAGPNSVAEPYCIVGVHDAGIDAPTEQLNLAISTSSWTIREIESDSVAIGTYSDIVSDSRDYPHIIYKQSTNTLKRAWYDGSSWHTETILTVGSHTLYGITCAIDSSDNIHVCYIYGTIASAAYIDHIVWDGASWSAPANVKTVTGTGAKFIYQLDMAIDASNYLHLAYIDIETTYADVNYKKYTTSWGSEEVPVTGVSTHRPIQTGVSGVSICVDTGNLPHIAYTALDTSGYPSTAGLFYTTWTGAAWSAFVGVDTTTTCMSPSIVTTSADDPIIAYYNSTDFDLKVATYSAGWGLETVDSSGSIGQELSAGITSTNLIRVAYTDGTNQYIKYAAWDGAAWTLSTVDSGNPASYPKLYLDSTNSAHVCYRMPSTLFKYATLQDFGSDTSLGTYKYKYTYYNSNTHYESEPVALSRDIIITAVNSIVEVSLPTDAQNPADPQINEIKVYRTKANGTLYYYLYSLYRGGSTYVFTSSAYQDGKGDDELTSLMFTASHLPPPATVKCIREFNGRLYGWGTDNILRFSTLNEAEYWPTEQWGASNPLDIASYQLEGGYITFGDESSKVMAVTPGISAGDSSDTQGAALLVQTEDRAYWWSGYDWSDFQLAEGYAASCVSSRTTCNSRGLIFWLSRLGPIMVSGGQVVPIYQKLFPLVSNQFEDIASKSYWQKAVAIIWRDWYICAYPAGSSTYNNKCCMYHIPTGTFTTLDNTNSVAAYASFDVSKDGTLFAGDAQYGKVWKLNTQTSTRTYFNGTAGTTGISHKYTSPVIYLDEPWKHKRLHYCRVLVDRPVVNQTVSLSVTPNNRATAATALSKTASSTSNDGRIWLFYPVQTDGYAFQFRITGTFTAPMKIHMIELGDITVHSDIKKE